MNRRINFADRIEVDPRKLAGKPVIRGTRISVEQVLRMLAQGTPEEEILSDFPDLTKEDIRAAIAYASETIAVEEVRHAEMAV